MPEQIIVDTSSLIALERLIESTNDKVKELREKGFYIFEELLDDIAKFKKSG